VDSHEREDVVKSREEFLKKLKESKESHLPPLPCGDERAATPPPDAEMRKKLMLLYHNESIFTTNEGQTWMWTTEDAPTLQPKTKGSGVMVSDFVDQLCMPPAATTLAYHGGTTSMQSHLSSHHPDKYGWQLFGIRSLRKPLFE